MARPTGWSVLKALAEIGIADMDTTRVVIDIRGYEAPKIYVEKIGDERLLSVVQTLDGVEITREAPTT